MLRLALALFVGPTLALAQLAPPAPAEVARPPRSEGWLVEAIAATVNDSAIMLSELRTVAAGTIRTATQQLGQLSPQEQTQILRRELNVLIDKHRMAQSAKSLGVLTPEQVEQLLRSEMARDQDELRRDLGSTLELGRAMQKQGRSWTTYEREQRADKLYQFAQEFAVRRRLARQMNLFVTPRMLRQAYDANRPMFVRSADARVGQVQFRGPTAMADATAAAAQWAQEDLTPRQLADRFADAIALPELPAGSLANPRLREFALAGPAGAVSAPQPDNQVVVLARVTRFQAARNGQFGDADVQLELRKICEDRVIQEFKEQALERARLRTEVWQSPAMRGS
jgi:PPIC-type PPIASE domain